jgi:hypothetical protein
MAKWNDKKADLKVVRFALNHPGYDSINRKYGRAARECGIDVESYTNNMFENLFSDYKVKITGNGWTDLNNLEMAIVNELKAQEASK